MNTHLDLRYNLKQIGHVLSGSLDGMTDNRLLL